MKPDNLKVRGIKAIERAMRANAAHRGSGATWLDSAMKWGVVWEWRPRTKRWIGVDSEKQYVFLVNSEGMVLYYTDRRAYHFALDSPDQKDAYPALFEYLVMRKYAH